MADTTKGTESLSDRARKFAGGARYWEKQETGWYTSDIGGICQEHSGWAFWPDDPTWPTIRRLPTLGAAVAEANRIARVKESE